MTQKDKDTKMEEFRAAWDKFFTKQMQCDSVQEFAEKTQEIMFNMWAFIEFIASNRRKDIAPELAVALLGLNAGIYEALGKANMARKLAEKSNI